MKPSIFTRIVMALAILSALAAAAPGAARAASLQDTDPTRIRFERGYTNAEISGKLEADDSAVYVLRAGRGQLLEVSLSAPEGASIEVTSQAGRLLTPVKGTSGKTGFRGYLPYSGDYLVEVFSSDEDISYSLYVSIPVRVSFDRGATSDDLQGELDAHQSLDYILRAGEGQILEINVNPQAGAETEPADSNAATDSTDPMGGAVQLIIYGVDGTVLRSGMGEGSSFRGLLPEDQDYLVSVRAGEQAVDFSLQVIIPQRIRFASGAYSGTVWTSLPAHRTQYYSLRAAEGQKMTIRLSNSAGLDLAVYGADGTLLQNQDTEGAAFDARLPSSQDYIVAVSSGSRWVSYRLKVTLR